MKGCSWVVTILLCGGAAWGDVADVERVAAPGGEVVFANPGDREVKYDRFTYAAARRAGDFVFLSGVEVGPAADEGIEVEDFKAQLRRAFLRMRASLTATGADLEDVVQIQSFHNCRPSHFAGGFNGQLETMIVVKSEFMPPPHPTWTALCVDGHFSARTIVEIQVTAFAPLRP